MPSLPRITSDIPQDVRNFLDKVREYITTSGNTRFVTVGELKNAGVVGTTPGGGVAAPQDYTSTNPTIPTGLSTYGDLASVVLTWVAANYLGHAFTEIWANTTDDLYTAELVGTAEGNTFTHVVGDGATRYYWIRFVNKQGTRGPYNQEAGTSGSPGQDPEYLINVLSDAYGVVGDAPFFQLDSPTIINGVLIPAGTYIKQAWIADATITNAKISGAIQSNSYTAGVSGWRIDKDGQAELNTATFRGTINVKSASSGQRLEITNSYIKVFDSSGTLRVQIGDLSA